MEDILEIKSANEWVREAKRLPVPKMLFGEFWLENELAIMFAETGMGKSALAVQIAESIARGAKFQDGFGEVTAKPQRVLYLDFELSRKQFEMRYAADHDEEKGEFLQNHYIFSDRFKIYRPKPEDLDRTDAHPFETVLRRMLEPLIESSRAKVLIVDNITYLKRRADRSSEAAPMMKELKRLKEKFGLSILVIAHTLKRSVSRPLVLNDMQGSNVITNYVDNIFCIGQNRQESNERYVKHIKLRSTKRFCGAEHVPVFRLKKIGGNFLGFAFQRFEPESEMLRDGTDGNLWRTIQTVKNLSDSGMSIRNIAEQLDLSKSAAHRYLQMWQAQPEVPRPLTYEEIHGPTIDDGWRPPEEEYPGQRSDQYLIKIGLRPVCKERWEAEQAALNAANQSEPEDVATGELFVNSVYSVVESYAAKETTEDTEHTENPLDRMKLVIDDHGKELFVESEYENGKPKIWYQYRSDGALRRWEHNGDCVNESAADPEVFGQVRQAVFELTTEDTESTEIF